VQVSIEHVARLVASAMQLPPAQLKFDTSKADGQFKKTASNAKLQRLCPDFKVSACVRVCACA
jgi:GDP-L-fucose synthase